MQAERRQVSFNLSPAIKTDEIIYCWPVFKLNFTDYAGLGVDNLNAGIYKTTPHIYIITMKLSFVKRIDIEALR